MTCVVAAKSGNNICLGSDSLSSDGWTKYHVATPKIFQIRDMLIGGSGSWRELQVLKYLSDDPCLGDRGGVDPEAFVVRTVVPRFRQVLKEQGSSKTRDGTEMWHGGYIVVVGGRIFRLDSDMQACELERPFAAVGSGEPVALGAMMVAHEAGMSAVDIVRRGLEAASEFAVGVSGPFKFLCVECDQ